MSVCLCLLSVSSCLPVCLTPCLSLSVCLFICLLPTCLALFVCLSLCACLCLSVCLTCSQPHTTRQKSSTYQLVGDLVDDVAVVHATSVVLHVLLDVDAGLVLIVGQVEVKPAQVQTVPLTQVPAQRHS